MTPEDKLAALAAEARNLAAKAQTADFTEADATRAEALAKEHAAVSSLVERKQKAAQAFSRFTDPVHDSREDSPVEKSHRGTLNQAGQRIDSKDRIPAVDTTKFTDNALDAFKAAAPSIGGPFAQKALVPQGAVVSRFEQTIVNDPRQSFSLYGAVQHVDASGVNSGTYLRQTVRDNQASAVKDGDLKPVSKYGLEQKSWRMATIAHVSEPMQRQWFQDYENLEAFLSSEMAYGLDLAVADMILNGDTDEDGNKFDGVLTTTGIGQTAYTTSPLRSIRKAITDLQVTGAVPTQIVLHPSAWEEIESSLTNEGAYLLDGAPQAAVAPQLFGLPVLLSTGLDPDKALVGDLSSIVVYDNGSVMFAWSEGGQVNMGTAEVPDNVELFRANKLVWRAEVRLGLAVMSTKLLRVAELAAAG